jgi:hypothetical protein
VYQQAPLPRSPCLAACSGSESYGGERKQLRSGYEYKCRSVRSPTTSLLRQGCPPNPRMTHRCK